MHKVSEIPSEDSQLEIRAHSTLKLERNDSLNNRVKMKYHLLVCSCP